MIIAEHREQQVDLADVVGAGDLAVVAARAGVGKSSCLVQLATAELLEGNSVLHVSLDNPVGHVRRWYDNQIDRIKARMSQPEDELRLEVERRRHIHCYLDDSFSAEKLATSCAFLKEHMDFEPRLALFAGEAGLLVYRRMLVQLARLGSGAWLAFEIGSNQEDEIRHLVAGSSFRLIDLRRDYADLPRVALLQRR